MPTGSRLFLAAALLLVAAGAALPGAAAQAVVEEFVPITPVRLVDTRHGEDHRSFDGVELDGRYHGNDILKFPVAGRGELPDEVLAVALNVTAVAPLGAGFLTVWPCTAQIPEASNVNYGDGQTVANAVISGTDFDGFVCITSYAPADIVVDVSGYFPITSTYKPLVPVRIEDSRLDTCWEPVEGQLGLGIPLIPVDDGGEQPDPECTDPLAGVALDDIPHDSEAVVLNVTATQTEGPGFVSVSDCSGGEPTTSTVNYTGAGQTVPNLAVAPVDHVVQDGMLCFDLFRTGHLIVDAFGYFPAGSGYTAIAPIRVSDTRPAEGGQGRLVAGQEEFFAAWGATDAGLGDTVSVNVTVTGTQGPGYVSVYPCGAEPTTSTVNFTGADQTVANAAIVSPGLQGHICYRASTGTHVIVDVTGYFSS